MSGVVAAGEAARVAERGSTVSSGGSAYNKIYRYKLVLLGESAVGKSSLVQRFVKGQFQDFQESTIGAAFLTQTVCLDNATVRFEIWDTAGQERYHSLAPMYYRGAEAAVIVYDVTSKMTFQRAKTWVCELQRQGGRSITMALTGNKADLSNAREVDKAEAESYADENGLLFAETSAKSGDNVNELFKLIAQKIPKSDDQSESSMSASVHQRLQLNTRHQGSSSGCCNK